ncbi:MAG: hypothetical protein M4579_006215 [Chaenotheca gracillima]|nr:MAG: hypothetical protein M4579_006215 [Chaenotheca gracillima]
MRSSGLLTSLSYFGLAAALATPKLGQDVINTAGGAPPNGPPPTNLSANAISGFQLANFLENLEAAFFEAGVKNMTSNGGWGMETFGPLSVQTIEMIAAQEQVHVATIQAILAPSNSTISPCNYTFPVESAADFVALASTITSVGIGAVNFLTASLATTDPDLVTGTSSIITVESRHDAFFRERMGLVPNPAPFDTQLPGEWAYSLALPFVVKDSCTLLPITALPPLAITGGTNSWSATASSNSEYERPVTINLLWDAQNVPGAADNNTQLFVAWVNQANAAVYTNVTRVDQNTGTAPVPQGLNGITFAALTNQTAFNTPADLVANTLAGPVPYVPDLH